MLGIAPRAACVLAQHFCCRKISMETAIFTKKYNRKMNKKCSRDACCNGAAAGQLYTRWKHLLFCCWKKSDALIVCGGLYFRKHGSPGNWWEGIASVFSFTVYPGYCIVNLVQSRVTGEERTGVGKVPPQIGLKDVFLSSGWHGRALTTAGSTIPGQVTSLVSPAVDKKAGWQTRTSAYC